MSDRDSQRSGDDRLPMSAALLAQTGRARGAAPSMRELRDWAHGELVGERLAEVESHIAFDSTVFEAAMAERRRMTATPQPRRRFGLALPTLVGAAAALIIGVAVVLEREPPVEDSEPGVLRGVTLTHPDWRVAAFRSGFAGTASDGSFANDLPLENCLDGDQCVRLAGVLADFGRTLAALESACAAGGANASVRAASIDALRAHSDSMAASLELGAWRGFIDSLAKALAAGGDEGCARSAALRAQLVDS